MPRCASGEPSLRRRAARGWRRAGSSAARLTRRCRATRGFSLVSCNPDEPRLRFLRLPLPRHRFKWDDWHRASMTYKKNRKKPTPPSSSSSASALSLHRGVLSCPTEVDVVRARELVRRRKDALLLLDHPPVDVDPQATSGRAERSKRGREGTHLIKSETWSRRMLTDSASMLVWAMKLGRLTVGGACRRKATSAESGKRSRSQLLNL